MRRTRGRLSLAICALVTWAVAVSACTVISQPIYLDCALSAAASPIGPESPDKLPWMTGVRSFTGKLPTQWETRGKFASLDVQVAEATDLEIAGTMDYLESLVVGSDGTVREAAEPKTLSYRFQFNRLNNQLLITYDEEVSPGNTHVHTMRFACRRVTP